jgi:hypothetical protein
MDVALATQLHIAQRLKKEYNYSLIHSEPTQTVLVTLTLFVYLYPSLLLLCVLLKHTKTEQFLASILHVPYR